MGKKGGKGRKPSSKNTKKQTKEVQDFSEDDEIDAFHKQRDVVPLDINDDLGDSDEDDEIPVLDIEGSENDDDDDEDDEDIEDDTQLTGLAAKIARQQKFLRAKTGGVEDEMHDDAEDDEGNRSVWGRRKSDLYSADNIDYELQSDDEELPAEEEAEVLRLQKEKAESLSMADFGLEDDGEDESDAEPTFEDMLVKGKDAAKPSQDKGAQVEIGSTYEEVKKDLNALTREEQMDVVYSAAPELVGLLTELNNSVEQLEKVVNPLLSKVKDGEIAKKRGVKYLELKQLLLLSYCQAITFYLLLKSEGQPVRDHPVIARLVEIKNLLTKMEKLDENLPMEIEDILNKNLWTESDLTVVSHDAVKSDTIVEDRRDIPIPAETQIHIADELMKVDSSKDSGSVGEKHKNQNDQIGLQSKEMLKVRAALEERLKQKGVFGSIEPKRTAAKKNFQPLNGKLETQDDFDDHIVDIEGGHRAMSNGYSQLSHSSTLSQIVTKVKKPKIISGDDDLPMRDDIGERRRKHELRVLAGAGIKSSDDVEDEPENIDADGAIDMEEDDGSESDFELYKGIEKQRIAKLAAKAKMYSRTPAGPSLPETLVDGKRHINYQMEKNRGLTRQRKKLIKNPRKKYKLKHKDAVNRRKGQVRDVKKQSGHYSGEASGINAGISRSIRF